LTIQTIDVGVSPDDGTGDPARTAGIKINANFAELLATKADGAATTAALAAKAPLASPALTGTPTAPTAALGTNTTQIATMAALKAAIDALIGGAPGALDTLAELATALASDASFASTMTTLLAAKAPLASPTFTGTVAVPAVAGTTDNSNQAATTAFVQAVVSAVAAPGIVKSYTSPQQVITSGGLLTLPHGMGVSPKFVVASLVCITSESGYISGQEFSVHHTVMQPDNRGVSVIFDATNLNVRFGSEPVVFTGLNPTTGAITTLTNANFKLILRAFA